MGEAVTCSSTQASRRRNKHDIRPMATYVQWPALEDLEIIGDGTALAALGPRHETDKNGERTITNVANGYEGKITEGESEPFDDESRAAQRPPLHVPLPKLSRLDFCFGAHRTSASKFGSCLIARKRAYCQLKHLVLRSCSNIRDVDVRAYVTEGVANLVDWDSGRFRWCWFRLSL